VTAPKIRRYTNLPGSPPSVTEILSAAWPKPDLQNWFVTETAKLAREHPETPIDQLLRKHGPRGAERGTSVHKLIAAYLSGLGEPATSGEAEQMFYHWFTWWHSKHRPPCQPEVLVAYQGFQKFAGTADAVSTVDSEIHVWDWKTASNMPDEPWPDHVAQVAAYAACLRDPLYYPAIMAPRAYVVYISLDGVRDFSISPGDLSDAWDAFLACYQLAAHLYPDQMKEVSHADR
jgi:hypothetical protein